MARARRTATQRQLAAGIVIAALPTVTSASLRAVGPSDYHSHSATCEFPVRLTHDCSIWQGPTRPIAFGGHRMNLAAGSEGRTILVSRLRPRPGHNAGALPGDGRGVTGLEVVQQLGEALAGHGIHLERTQPLRRGRRVDAFLLDFSANAYDYLKRFTVLESEHWLPPPQRGR